MALSTWFVTVQDVLSSASLPLAELAARGLALSLVVVLAALLVRRRSAQIRHGVWLAGVGMLLLLPLLQGVLPRWRVLPATAFNSAADSSEPGRERSAAMSTPHEAVEPSSVAFDGLPDPRLLRRPENSDSTPATSSEPEAVLPQLASTPDLPSASAAEPAPVAAATSAEVDKIDVPVQKKWEPVSWPGLVVAAWLAGVIALAARLVIGQLALRRLCRSAEVVDSPEWRERIRKLSEELGLASRVEVWRLDRRVIPMACGVFRPRVIVPSDVDGWDEDRLRTVLLHELAHIRRRDCLTQWLAEIARMIYWLNPVVWLTVRRMRVERERACDDLVLGRGLTAPAYADQLVRMTAEYPTVRFQVPLSVGMARRSGLEQRVRRILDETTDRRSFTRLGLMLLVAAAGLLALPMSMLDQNARADLPEVAEASTDVENEKEASQVQDRKTTQKAGSKPAKKTRANTAPDADLLYEVKCQQNEIEAGGRIAVETKLTNRGKDAVTVYWGDYAHPDMYRFDIRHAKTKERLPTTRYGIWREKLSSGGNARYFKKIEPGQSVTYNVMLMPGPGSNAQHVFFRKPGTYLITPSLNVVTYRAVDRNSGKATLHPRTWTGKLKALPFAIRVTEKTSPVADEQLAFAGTAVNHDGTPATGAIIKVFEFVPSFGSIDGVSERQVDQVYADERGRFRVERLARATAEFRLIAWSENDLTYATRVSNKGTKAELPVDIKFAEPVKIRGLVVDPEGKPLEGVRVSSREFTDQDGHFTLTMGRSNEYRFQLWQRGYLDSYHIVPHKEATDGVWRAVLTPEKNAKITGKATFADGTPLRNLKLQFTFTAIREEDRKSYSPGKSCETKSDGSFEMTLPEAIQYSATVTAFEASKHNIGRVWKASVDEVGPGSPLALKFDNRNRLRIRLSQTEPLPESLELTLRCQLDSRRTMEERHVPVSSKEIEFARLTPGKYRTEAVVRQARHLHFDAYAEIPAGPDPQTATVDLKIPAFKFGDLTARFVRPDGRSPYQGPISISSTGSSGSYQTDNAGRVTIRTVPVGRVHLRASRAAGIADAPIAGIVKADEAVDLGTIRLKAEDEVYGWVEGRVIYPDGTPLVGASATGIAAGVDTGLTSQPIGFRGDGNKPKGEYKVRLEKGAHNVTFDLTTVATWPGGKPGGNGSIGYRPFGFPKKGFHRLTARLKAEPGKTLSHDIVVPRFKPGRSLKINFARSLPTKEDYDPKRSFSMHAPMVTTLVRSGDVYLSGAATMKDNGDGTSSATMDKVPTGEGHVVFVSFNPGWMAIAEFGKDDASPEVHLDPKQSATIVTRVLGEDGKPLRGIGFYVSTMLAGHELGIARVFPLPAGQTKVDKPRHWMMEERQDGTVLIRGLGPMQGEVSFEISGDTGSQRWAHRVPLNLKGRAGAIVTWQVDGSGKLLSKELVFADREQLLK